jgi:hypothetical protein
MQQNFHRDGRKFISRCNEISIVMEILRYHDENLQPLRENKKALPLRP